MSSATKNTNPAGNPKIGEVSGMLISPPSKDAPSDEDKKESPADLMGDLTKAKRRAQGTSGGPES